MKKIIALLFFVVSQSAAQPADYWQQHVSYTISGTLIDSIHSFDGKLAVVYTNNSPDTLHEVWFHLYYNAFQPGSMMDERAKALNDRGVAEKIEHYKRSDWGGQTISKVSVPVALIPASTEVRWDQPMKDLDFKITGTSMKVILEKPLAPNSSVTLFMPFFVQIPLLTRRGGWMNADGIKYSMSQWYPKICEYDREGWHHQEYVAREFYGVWGDFDVTMTVPSKYCVGSTGQCQNPEEVGWGYDQIARGVKKGKVYPDSVASAQHSPFLTWHFKASNVHDFAWVAHEYIHEWDTWSDTITVHCLYKPSEDAAWKDAMPNTFFMLNHHSHKVGWYQYRNFTNTHAGDGGMEYPQLIMDGSASSGLIAHEGGHQWFYGMLGNNETRYAFLDEGFTEFIEMTCQEAHYGRNQREHGVDERPWLSRMFIPETDTRRNYYAPYLDLATSGYEEPLTIPHDWFREGVNAGQVYFKTLAGLAQLEYVLGDSMFWAGMKEYFRRWHFKHPTLNDFKRTMQDVSGADLDYYFDEWFASTRTIDYAATGLESEKQSDGTYKTTVKLRNKDLGVAPIDLTLHYEDGSTGIATIPLAVNQDAAYRKPEAGRLFFPGWDWVRPTYKGSITTPKEVSWYEIDTSCRLMDLNRRNNYEGLLFPKTEWALWTQLNMAPPLDARYAILRPIIGYDAVSKMNLGVGLLSGQGRHNTSDLKLIFKFSPERVEDSSGHLGGPKDVKTRWYDYLDGEIKDERNVRLLGRLTKFSFDIRKFNDIGTINIALEHEIRPTYLYLGASHKFKFDFDLEERGPFGEDNILYPIYPFHWDSGLERSLGFRYHYSSASKHTQAYFFARVGNLMTVDRSYQGDTLIKTNTLNAFTQYGIGITQIIPFSRQMDLKLHGSFGKSSGVLNDEYEYNISGATNSEMLRNDFFRTAASLSRHFSSEAHYFVEGGAGVRGYTGQYFDPLGNITVTGNDMIGLNADLKLPNPFESLGSFAASFEFGLFTDAGWTGSFQYGNP
ncbi:MAG: M1 family metallopeptidase, partial [Bacteroidota bacterium]|nr:M1 family metallopeptidase [Bacteroidota bacterium]